MDKQGYDENITSQGFGSLIYGPQDPNDRSNLTVHDVESALICLPSEPDNVYAVGLNSQKMTRFSGWTHENQNRVIKIDNFYQIATASDTPTGFTTTTQINTTSSIVTGSLITTAPVNTTSFGTTTVTSTSTIPSTIPTQMGTQSRQEPQAATTSQPAPQKSDDTSNQATAGQR